MSSDPNNWRHDNPSVVIHFQGAIRVFPNDAGSVTIAQEREWCDDEDSLVVVRPENALKLARAVIAAAGRVPPSDIPEVPDEGPTVEPRSTKLPATTSRKAAVSPQLELVANDAKGGGR